MISPAAFRINVFRERMCAGVSTKVQELFKLNRTINTLLDLGSTWSSSFLTGGLSTVSAPFGTSSKTAHCQDASLLLQKRVIS